MFKRVNSREYLQCFLCERSITTVYNGSYLDPNAITFFLKVLKTAGRVKVTQKAGGVTDSRASGLNENSLGRQQEMWMIKTKNTLERCVWKDEPK